MNYVQSELLFDGPIRKELGVQQVLSNTSEAWKEIALGVIEDLARSRESFTSDDLREVLGEVQPDHPNAFGAIFSSASKKKIIKRIGYTTSKIPSCQGHVISQWKKYE